jgi:hypothetical protein
LSRHGSTRIDDAGRPDQAMETPIEAGTIEIRAQVSLSLASERCMISSLE